MSLAIKTILLLFFSNTFMLTAWYLHLKLKFLDERAAWVASVLSWGIAFFEYQFHIPANRIGSEVFNLPQLQIIQISMSLILFIPFSMIVMNKSFNFDYVIACALIILATYFIFRTK